MENDEKAVFSIIKEVCLNQAKPYLEDQYRPYEIMMLLEGVNIATIQSKLVSFDANRISYILSRLIEKGLEIEKCRFSDKIYFVQDLFN